MEMPGGSSVKSSLLSMALSCLQQTVSSLRWQMLNIKNVCLQQIPPDIPVASTFRQMPKAEKTSPKLSR